MTPGTRAETTGAAPLDQVTRGLRQRRAWIAVLVLGQLSLLANGQAVFGSQFPVALVGFYLNFMAWPLILDEALLNDLLKSSMAEYVIKFSTGFLVGVAFFMAVFVGVLHAPPNKIAYSQVASILVLQVAVVAPAEELFFRGFLPRLYDPGGKSWKMYLGVSLSDALVSGTFSLFHYAAYGKDAPASYIIAFGLSLVWLYISRREVGFPWNPDGARRPMGLAFVMGWHAGHNSCAFGPLVGGVVFGQ